jgi:hypothetical protein
VIIKDEGIYDIPTDAYLGDPVDGGSLSSSALRELDRSPQHFRDYVASGSTSSRAQSFGTAAHVRVLGVGHDIAVMQHDGRTKAGKAERAEAKAAGATIVSEEEAERIEAMAAALAADERAAELLVPDDGLIEHTIVWRDDESGQMCRAMLDFLRHVDDQGQRIVVDYKTTRSVDPDDLEKAIYSFGYYRSGAWYRAGAQHAERRGLLPPAEHTRFVLIFQESTRPYAPMVVPVDETALAWGEVINRKSVDRYLECVEANDWPGPARNRWVPLGIPYWARRRLEDADAAGAFLTRADRQEMTR